MKAISFLVVFLSMQAQAQVPIQISQELLERVRYGKNVEDILITLSELNEDELAQSLKTDEQRKTFWINIYNAAVQYQLKKDSSVYKNRMGFYKKKAIVIAGKNLSPNDIEHGILRRGQWIYGLGYVRKWFPSKYERKMRVDELDPRIHFALNCGAKGCPPILFYEVSELNSQLELATKSFLQLNTRIENDELFVTKLFSWYRGDFGSKKDVIQFLVEYHILADPPRFKTFAYDEYNWQLELNMYKE